MVHDDDDKLPPIGAGSEKCLEDARKGKARSFLLVCKGPKIRFLSVRKRPVKVTELNEARKLGYKGDGFFGVITGQSVNLVFNLARSDGYDKAPVKELELKEFLETHAQLRGKPTFNIVDLPPVIPFDEEDLKNPVVARFMKLDEAISKVLDAWPEREAELTASVTEIRRLLQDGAFENAAGKLDAFVKSLSGPALPPTSTTATEEKAPNSTAPTNANSNATTGPDPEQLRVTARLTALKPKTDRAIAAQDAYGQEVKLQLSQVALRARKREFQAANIELDKLELLLVQTGAQRRAAVDLLAVWSDAKDAVDEQLNRFTSALRKTGDEYLVRIAEGGVTQFVEGPSRTYVNLMASLFEYEQTRRAGGLASSGAIRSAVQDYRAFVQASGFVRVCDGNRLCGPLSIRPTLLDALERIESALPS